MADLKRVRRNPNGLSAAGLSDPYLRQVIEDLQNQVRGLSAKTADAGTAQRDRNFDSFRVFMDGEITRLDRLSKVLKQGQFDESRKRAEVARDLAALNAYPVRNDTGSTVPAFGIATAVSYNSTTDQWTIWTPTADDTGMLVCFGSFDIPTGRPTVAYRRDIGIVRVASADFDSVGIGSIIGRVEGSFEAALAGLPDFKVTAKLTSPYVLAEMLHQNVGTTYTDHLDVILDGLGEVLQVGSRGTLTFDYPCTIAGWKIVGLPSGSISVDLWKASSGNFPPTIADSITGSSPPTVSSDDEASSSTLTDWDTALIAGDVLMVYILSCSDMTLATLGLKLNRPPA